MTGTKRSILAAALVFIAIASLAPSGSAQTTANGPYYATPSWDQTLPSATRFIVLANFASQAVLDRETGLVWDRVPDTTNRLFADAMTHCADRTVGGRQGWRLPTIQELRSLVDPTVGNPALPTGHPFTVLFRVGAFIPTPIDVYWSSTASLSSGSTFTHNVSFASASSRTSSNKSTASQLAWCVRGGSGLEAQ